MTQTARKPLPPWLPPISLAVCAMILALVSIAWHFVPLKVTGQAFLLIVILHAFCYWPPMVRLVTSMPVAHRVVFCALLGAMVLGHYSLNGRTYFPYIAWEIFPFVREDDPVTCPEFIATTASGAKVRLLVEQLFPSIVQVDNVQSYPPETTEHVARAMAKVYNELHPADPVQRVDLYLMAVKLHPPAGESRAQPSSELLKCYDISSGQ